jgi:nucleosome assembly protein 1-like 1
MFKIELDKENPFMFEAPESQRSLGCQITWNEKKNVTLAENKLQESFFNYFSSSLSKDKATCEDETEIALDYEIGYLFKEKIIPRAILYYLDEIVEDNDDDDDIHEDYEDVESIDLNDSLQKIKEN